MVKFGKQLEGSLVPEWKDAYCNYKELKRIVKRIKLDRLNNAIPVDNGPTTQMELFGSMSSLHNLETDIKSGSNVFQNVFSVHKRNSWNDEHKCEVYEMALKAPLDHAQQDRIFFNRLDAELNKIERFYKSKEVEYVAQADRLEKQLLTLFEVQETHKRQSLKLRTFSKRSQNIFGESSSGNESDFAVGISTSKEHENPLLQTITAKSDDLEVISPDEYKEVPSTGETELSNPYSSCDEELGIIANFIENVVVSPRPDVLSPTAGYHKRTSSWSTHSRRLPSPDHHDQQLSSVHSADSDAIQVLHQHKESQSDAESPFHAVKRKSEFHELHRVRETVQYRQQESKSIIQDMIDMSLSKKKIQTSEKMLRSAFIEFYRGLSMLKSYSSLNLVAFAKIMKKYDKVAKQRLKELYIKEVEASYFASSDKVTRLMTEVEDIFTKHFSEHDRRKAMAQLRPLLQRGGHSITFFLGIFSGSSISLLVALMVLLGVDNQYRIMGGKGYMDTVFHVFSLQGLVLLHMYMYGWNVYAWQRTRINYPFIFGFSPGTELRYREVLLVCTAFTSILVGTSLAHIISSTRETPHYYSSEYAPFGIFLVFVMLLFTPLNILYRSSRVFFLRCMRHILLSPFYKVVLADFFLGDQLTSQVASFRNFEFMICYYSGGYFHNRDKNACSNNKTFQDLMYLFSLLPYWFRFLQCLRRWRDEGDKHQLYNAGKYASSMMAMAMRLYYTSHQNTIQLVLFIFFSCFATLYQLYWDLVVDWGLLQPKSKNRWLRDNLILKKKYLYFVAMALNAILRLAWISSIQHVQFIPGFSSVGWDIIFASLEVIRRGQWNFFRLENEHLNNVGKYRAVKTVPLPFKEIEGAEFNFPYN